MKNIIKTLLGVTFLCLVSCQLKTQKPKNLKLWYTQPAKSWEKEALPIGNGYVGIMFFGGHDKEQLQVCDATLWEGGPGSNPEYNFGTRNGAWKNLEPIRKLLKNGKLEQAHELANKGLTGVIHQNESNKGFGDYGSQQTMGDLFVSVQNGGEVENYERGLNISDATGFVNYQSNGVNHERKYFANYPSKVVVYEFRNDAKNGADYELNFKTPHIKISEEYSNSFYAFVGKVAGNNMPFEYKLKIDSDGDVEFVNGSLRVTNSNKLVIYQATATGYKNDYPTYNGNEYLAENNKTFTDFQGKTLNDLYTQHVNDYHSLYNRVDLNLAGSSLRDSIATNDRLLEYHEGAKDAGLITLFFQYNRYLMISGSRPGTMPLNLQGKWNNSTNPAWACDYHMNINQQMLYWPVEIANLSECHGPLLDYTESLVVPGRVSAKEFFNARGWTVSTMNNPFGFTANGWGFPWGYFPGGGAWLCSHFWEHYQFTKDKKFLKERAYPIMKEAALFWIDLLVEDENGNLVSCPSYSPEHGGISTGASMDHQIAYNLLSNCINACDVLSIDKEFRALALATRDKICSPKIGSWGQLQEWNEDVDDPKNTHRHVSHLFALYPGEQISMGKTPKLAEAAKKSLIARSDNGTGWSRAWKVNFWARLKDGNHAYKVLRGLLKPADIKGLGRGGAYDNLLCTHPPFQLDGNMGSCAGIAEMLLQSHGGVIELLPALPDVWKKGSVRGFKARGNFEIAIEWDNGELITAQIKGNKGDTGSYKYKEKTVDFTIPESGIIYIE